MAGTFRESMGGLHTWTGLVFSWVLFFMFVTGSFGYFDTEIDRWMQPELPIAEQAQAAPAEQSVATAQRFLTEHHSGAEEWYISLPHGRDSPWLRVWWNYPDSDEGGLSEEERFGDALLDPVTGDVLTGRDTGGGQRLYKMHWKLAYMPRMVSDLLVGIFTMLMLLALITGIIIHRNIFRDFFSFRPGKRQRSWLDLHNLTSVASLPFQLMITYSGLLFFLTTYMPLIALGSYGFGGDKLAAFINEVFPRERIERQHVASPVPDLRVIYRDASQRKGDIAVTTLEVHWPGDAGAQIHVSTEETTIARNPDELAYDSQGALIQQPYRPDTVQMTFFMGMLGLHEGEFAGITLRWLYFFSGLLGALMVASGLVLWSVKRRARQLKQAVPDRGFRFVERLNAGTLVGLPVGIAAYFLANRLLPLELAERADWEQHLMFLSWLGSILFACARPVRSSWIELCALAALSYLLLPLVNALTTDRHLLWSLAEQNWVMAGVDLAFLVTGALFAVTAVMIRRHWKQAQPKHRAPTPDVAPQQEVAA